jgi:hypothetical protein
MAKRKTAPKVFPEEVFVRWGDPAIVVDKIDLAGGELEESGERAILVQATSGTLLCQFVIPMRLIPKLIADLTNVSAEVPKVLRELKNHGSN